MPRGSKPGERGAHRPLAEASGMLPHAFLLAVTRGEPIGDHTPTFEERLEAAKASAPYVAPKLSSVEQSGSLPINHEDALGELEQGDGRSGTSDPPAAEGRFPVATSCNTHEGGICPLQR